MKIRFYAGCADGDARSAEKSMEQATICTEGLTGTDMFVIMSGLVVVEKGDRRLGFLGEHHFFGELTALLPPKPGSWGRPYQRTCYAIEDTVVGVLSHQALMQLREDHSEIDEAVAPFVSTALGAELRGGDYKDLSADERQTVQDYYMKYARTERSVYPKAGKQNLTLPSRSEIENRSGVGSSSAPSREAGSFSVRCAWAEPHGGPRRTRNVFERSTSFRKTEEKLNGRMDRLVAQETVQNRRGRLSSRSVPHTVNRLHQSTIIILSTPVL